MSAGGKRSSPERLAKAVPKNVQTSKAVFKGRDTASEVFLFISLFCFQPQAPRSQITELRVRSVIPFQLFRVFSYPADHVADKLDMFFHFHFFQIIDRLFAAQCKERNIAEAFIISKLAAFLYCGIVLLDTQIFFI